MIGTMNSPIENQDENPQIRVFLSYARQDLEQLRKLVNELKGRSFVPIFDLSEDDQQYVETGISAEDDWWNRIQDMIVRSDVMLILVSPSISMSKVCAEEIAFARSLSKRIIPVLVSKTDFSRLSPHLAALNIKLDISVEPSKLEGAIKEIVDAILTDVHWYRSARKFDERAMEWRSRGKPVEFLLTKVELKDFEEWSMNRPRYAEPLSTILDEYYSTSYRIANKRDRIRSSPS